MKTEREAEIERGVDAVGAKAKEASRYRVTLVAREELKLIASSPERPVAEAPRYNSERDEPAFQRVWRKVSELRTQGKIAPVPSIPPGGICLRGAHAKSGK